MSYNRYRVVTQGAEPSANNKLNLPSMDLKIEMPEKFLHTLSISQLTWK